MSASDLDSEILARQKANASKIKKALLVVLAVVIVAGAVYGVTQWLLPTLHGQQAVAQTDGNLPGESSVSDPEIDGVELIREKLQQKLSNTDTRLSTTEQDPGRSNWNAASLKRMRNSLQLAFGSYAEGDYADSAAHLQGLEKELMQFEQQYQQAWQTQFTTAQTAWKNQNIPEAQIAVKQTLQWRPDYQPALDLQARLTVWQSVQSKLEALQVAEVENNVPKQRKLMREILELDPQHIAIQHKLNALENQLTEQQFANFVGRAVTALDKDDLQAAEQALAKAEEFDSDRPEVQHLGRQISQRKKQRAIDRFTQQIAAMQQADNWPAAQKLSENARQAHPEVAQFELSYELASEVLWAQQQLRGYLERPARLQDSQIRQNAQGLLERVSEIEIASATLQQQAQALRDELTRDVDKVEVLVESDGKTDIRVLGTGIVGKVKQKTIQLTPGVYRFEGRREGYRSKIVQVDVTASMVPMKITLICDEKI